MDMKKYDATVLLTEAMKKHDIDLNLLVAETSLWAHPEVHKRLLKDNRSGAFYPNVRRAQKGEKRGEWIGKIKLDDNTHANNAIKKAIGIPHKNLIRFACCHIWPGTCYNEKCHTVIANLILLPASLASLTDHNEEIQDLLKYRSYELYRWLPPGESRPRKPKHYPDCWKKPFDFTSRIEEAIRKRRF